MRTGLEQRLDNLAVLSESHLSMAMVISVIENLAVSYKVSQTQVIMLFNERVALIDLKASSVDITIVYKDQS